MSIKTLVTAARGQQQFNAHAAAAGERSWNAARLVCPGAPLYIVVVVIDAVTP